MCLDGITEPSVISVTDSYVVENTFVGVPSTCLPCAHELVRADTMEHGTLCGRLIEDTMRGSREPSQRLRHSSHRELLGGTVRRLRAGLVGPEN